MLSHGGLQQPGSFVTKVIQLYDTMNVRFGVMLVGPTGGGKTECYRTLQVSVPTDRICQPTGQPRSTCSHTLCITCSLEPQAFGR